MILTNELRLAIARLRNIGASNWEYVERIDEEVKAQRDKLAGPSRRSSALYGAMTAILDAARRYRVIHLRRHDHVRVAGETAHAMRLLDLAEAEVEKAIRGE